jgi:hypothetical protein
MDVNDKVSWPTLRSVRLPGAHMPTLAIKAKRPTHFQPCFALRPQRLGATSPREAFGVKFFLLRRRSRFFEGEVMGSKTLSVTQNFIITSASKK